jgi:hypothetical protein
LNIGSIRLPELMAERFVPVLLEEIPETPDTLDLSDVDLVKPAPRVAEDGSSDICAGESERVVVISVPDEDPSLSGKAIEVLPGEDWVEGITLPIEGERPGKTDAEGARSRPRAFVWTTSWTCRFRWCLDAVGGGLTIIYV